jgi:hypothetical protein
MNPAKFFCGIELIGTKSPGDDDFGIADLLFDLVKVAKLNNVKLREFFPQPLGKPGVEHSRSCRGGAEESEASWNDIKTRVFTAPEILIS